MKDCQPCLVLLSGALTLKLHLWKAPILYTAVSPPCYLFMHN